MVSCITSYPTISSPDLSFPILSTLIVSNLSSIVTSSIIVDLSILLTVVFYGENTDATVNCWAGRGLYPSSVEKLTFYTIFHLCLSSLSILSEVLGVAPAGSGWWKALSDSRGQAHVATNSGSAERTQMRWERGGSWGHSPGPTVNTALMLPT